MAKEQLKSELLQSDGSGIDNSNPQHVTLTLVLQRGARRYGHVDCVNWYSCMLVVCGLLFCHRCPSFRVDNDLKTHAEGVLGAVCVHCVSHLFSRARAKIIESDYSGKRGVTGMLLGAETGGAEVTGAGSTAGSSSSPSLSSESDDDSESATGSTFGI